MSISQIILGPLLFVATLHIITTQQPQTVEEWIGPASLLLMSAYFGFAHLMKDEHKP